MMNNWHNSTQEDWYRLGTKYGFFSKKEYEINQKNAIDVVWYIIINKKKYPIISIEIEDSSDVNQICKNIVKSSKLNPLLSIFHFRDEKKLKSIKELNENIFKGLNVMLITDNVLKLQPILKKKELEIEKLKNIFNPILQKEKELRELKKKIIDARKHINELKKKEPEIRNELSQFNIREIEVQIEKYLEEEFYNGVPCYVYGNNELCCSEPSIPIRYRKNKILEIYCQKIFNTVIKNLIQKRKLIALLVAKDRYGIICLNNSYCKEEFLDLMKKYNPIERVITKHDGRSFFC